MASSAASDGTFHLGMVGLGRMGANMARRLSQKGHLVVGWDPQPDVRDMLAAEGIEVATDLSDLVQRLTPPRAVWLMVPAAVTERVVLEVAALLEPGDAVVDGGNSHYRAAVDRAERLKERGIAHVDVGTSGGVWGLSRGYCLMVGAEPEVYARLEPFLASLAPGLGTIERTGGRTGSPSTEEQGFLHCGPPGAGHFAKMVHNAIEYGLMAAYGEGFNILRNADAGKWHREKDAETAPLEDSKYYHFDFEIGRVAELWRRGSVIPSWLLDLTAAALQHSPDLAEFSGHVSDSGEGRWAQQAAIDEGVPSHVLSAALFDRFASRGEGEFSNKILSAMRLGFGGHIEKKGQD